MPAISQKFVWGHLAGRLPFVRFGQGPEALAIFPGISDALLPVTLKAHYLVWFHRRFAPHYTVYLISRKRALPQGYTTREMAQDYAEAIGEIESPVHVLGLSMGSMIAQHLAVDSPELLRGLVLSLGCSRSVPSTVQAARHWIKLAREEKWNKVYEETVNLTYSGFRRILWQGLTPILFQRPEFPTDFIVSLEACIQHDARNRLSAIRTPALVLGAQRDRLVPETFYRELAGLIPNATLCLFDGAGHGVYEENQKEFESAIIEFLNKLYSKIQEPVFSSLDKPNLRI